MDSDGDKVPDARDQCKHLAGSSADGCPGPTDVKAIVVVTGKPIQMFGTRGQAIDCTNPGYPWSVACTELAIRLQSSGLPYGDYDVGYEVHGGYPRPCEKRKGFHADTRLCEPVYATDLQVNPYDYCKAAGWTAVKFTLNRERSTDDYWLLNVSCDHESFTPEECRIHKQIAFGVSSGMGIGAVFKRGRWLTLPGTVLGVLSAGVDCDYRGETIPIP